MTPTRSLQGAEFADIDRHFASFAEGFGGDRHLISWAAAALSRAVREGHIYIELPRLSRALQELDANGGPAVLPTMSDWRKELAKSNAVGGPNDVTPLVLDRGDRLYLRRYWDYQARLAEVLKDKCSRNVGRKGNAVATQEDAVSAAASNELTIICGGPGTGKTTTVVTILSRLMEESSQHLRISLAAPTGKAAARLEETIEKAMTKLGGTEALRSLMPHSATTIHRLLGRKGPFGSFRHDAENPLPVDVLVIDEASMIALPLLAKLFDALPPRCRVILLGDRDQLASVEPGAVLADVVDAAETKDSPVASALVTLKKNYRFAQASGIDQVCTAVREGHVEAVIELLRGSRFDDLISKEVVNSIDLNRQLGFAVTAGFANQSKESDPATALAQLNAFRVLTPLREGPWGVSGLNQTIETALHTAGLISAPAASLFAGRPILVLKNDYNLALYNGDLGIILPDPAGTNPQLYAWFVAKGDEARRLAYARLPEHETAYAMTVHKSQGSEFERVLFILPSTDRFLLTRELIYTGLTRARSVVEFWWNEPVLRAALSRRAERNSGLGDLLNGTKTC